MVKFPKILFFINGTVPTQKDIEEAEQCGFNVVFRNASMVSVEGALEDCAGVAGSVPARYAAKYPPAQEALELFMQSRRKSFSGTSGDSEKKDEPMQAKVSESAEKKPKPAKDVKWEPNT